MTTSANAPANNIAFIFAYPFLLNPFPPQPFEKGFFGQALCVLGRMFGETLEDLTLALDILTPFLGMVLGEPSEFMQEQRLPFGIALGWLRSSPTSGRGFCRSGQSALARSTSLIAVPVDSCGHQRRLC